MKTRVIGCPKTIDGDLKCKDVPISFGFDTACKVMVCFLYVLKQSELKAELISIYPELITFNCYCTG